MAWGSDESSEDRDDLLEELPTSDGNPMWALFSNYASGYYLEFVVGGVATILARFTGLLPAFVLGIGIDAVFRDETGFVLPLVPQDWIPTTQVGQLYLLVGLIGGAYLTVAVLSWVNSWAWNHFAQHLQHEVRTDSYDAVQDLDMAFFDDHQTGEIMSILNNDVNQLEDFLTNQLNAMLRLGVLIVGVAAIMLYINWQFALVGLLSIPLLAIASHLFVQIIQPKYQQVRSSVGRLNARLENNIGGIDVVKSYNRQDYESARVEDTSEAYLDANWDAITTRIKFFPSLRVITGFGFALTLLTGGWWVMFGPPLVFSGELTIGSFITFLFYSRRFLWPMRRFGEVINEYEYAYAASERIFGLMHYTPGVADLPDATPLTDVHGDVEYDDVTFSYEGDDDPEVDHVSFEANAGDMVGLVGQTGAGKTTLMRLLVRLYAIDEGTIRIDGTDIRGVTRESLRDAIGYVSQEPFLFQGTVRENITYGNPDATEAAIEDAARTAGAWEFIEDLPDGLGTVVGERGVKLSGGQRQRVALARAIIKDPEILILDEATSHVDNETEVLIKSNLDDLVAERTTFVIAHRLSTVRDADRILVLDSGRVVERGTHEQLLADDGLYANLWRVQVGELEALPTEFIERAARQDPQPTDDD